MTPIEPSPQYDRNNEAQFRTRVRQNDLMNMKKNEALPFFLMLNDDGSTYRVTLVGGVLTPTLV